MNDNVTASKFKHLKDDLYGREVGRFPLLSRAEEIELAGKIKRGNRKAFDHFVNCNLRLVIRLANQYRFLGVDVDDLAAEGNIGLMKAVEKFDPKFKVKFSTYAVLWIKQYMRRALSNTSRTIRIPSHIHDKLSQLHKASQRLAIRLGREFTDEELREELGISEAAFLKLKIAKVEMVAMDSITDEEGNLADVIADEQARDPCKEAGRDDMNKDLKAAMSSLSARDQLIMATRYGLNGQDPSTLEEVGKKFNLTRERIRQIQVKTLRKLRKKLKK